MLPTSRSKETGGRKFCLTYQRQDEEVDKQRPARDGEGGNSVDVTARIMSLEDSVSMDSFLPVGLRPGRATTGGRGTRTMIRVSQVEHSPSRYQPWRTSQP